MNLSYKEKSLILAGLDELFRRQDLQDLMVKVAKSCHTDLDQGIDKTIPDRHRDIDTRGLR